MKIQKLILILVGLLLLLIVLDRIFTLYVPKTKLEISGNKLVDPDNNEVVLRGIAIMNIWHIRYLDDEYYNGETIKWYKDNWGINVLRISIQCGFYGDGTSPDNWIEPYTDEQIALLDRVIKDGEQYGIYILVDWHTFGNLSDTNLHYRTISFWRWFANRYKDSPVVLYEIFNEPYGISWNEWKVQVTEVIDTIRTIDPESVIFVAGVDWGYDLSDVKANPIERENVGYITHPYPNKENARTIEQWEEYFGYLADTYPIIASEFQFPTVDGMGDYEWGRDLHTYLYQKNISFTGWSTYPDNSGQSLFLADGITPTPHGFLNRYHCLMKDKAYPFPDYPGCNNNGRCGGTENWVSCPKDCKRDFHPFPFK
jgi:aryl-phospho-beta-D-glucosidase BglC (GH1 family)